LNDSDLEDLALIRSFQEGDQAAFRKLFLKYRRKVIAAFIAQQIPEDEALDQCQELFIHLFERLPTLSIQSSFSAFLYSVVRNKIIDYYRRLKKYRRLFHINPDDFCAENDQETNSENLKQYRKIVEESYFDFIDSVEHCLKALGNPRWQAMITLWLEGCTYEQIAELLELHQGSVSSGLHRCIQIFIECMKKHYFNL